MKKTLIALFALSSIAMAVTRTVDITSTTGSDFNTDWETILSDIGYVYGNDYTLTLNVTGGLAASGANAYIMQLTDTTGGNRYLVNQNNGADVYFGINTRTAAQGKNDMPSGWTNTFTLSANGDTTTLTEALNEVLCSWTMTDATHSGSRAWNNSLTLTISYTEAQGTVVQYSYGSSTAAIDKFVMPTTSLDLNDFSVKNGIVLNGSNGRLSVTPEPATATLSLLALAGLCARRRRH